MLKEFFENIKPNSTVAIYGAGINGIEIKKSLEKNRPDVNILCFFDTFKEGTEDGLIVKKLKEIPSNRALFDLLVVSIRRSLHDLHAVFDYLNIPYIQIPRETEKYIRLNMYIEKQKEAEKIFESQENKDLYNMLWSVRMGKNPSIIEDYAWNKYGITKLEPLRNYNFQYLDKINKDAIKTVFDGGFYNGVHALLFKKQMKNLKELYAFEPMYEKFMNDNYDKFLQKENFVKIIPFGLWNASREIEFCENTTAKAGSRIRGTKEGNQLRSTEVVVKINTTTIDETREKENVEKVDFIKMDIEGSELPALKGGLKTITKDRPQLAISIYHSNDDFVDIPLFLQENLKDYTFRLGHYSFDLCETVLYAIPNELL